MQYSFCQCRIILDIVFFKLFCGPNKFLFKIKIVNSFCLSKIVYVVTKKNSFLYYHIVLLLFNIGNNIYRNNLHIFVLDVIQIDFYFILEVFSTKYSTGKVRQFQNHPLKNAEFLKNMLLMQDIYLFWNNIMDRS